MLKGLIENIAETILEQNTYFSNGFSNVIRNPDKGLVLQGDVAVFPSDKFLNYFYIRRPNNTTFDNSAFYSIAESIKGVGLSSQVVLVAVVSKADPDKLLGNILNTLQGLCGETITFTNAIDIKEEVIRQELEFMTDDARTRALGNVGKDLTIVSISFTIAEPFEYNKCIIDPCSC